MYYYLNNAKIVKNLDLYKCYMLIFYNELILLKFLSKILFKIFFSDYYPPCLRLSAFKHRLGEQKFVIEHNLLHNPYFLISLTISAIPTKTIQRITTNPAKCQKSPNMYLTKSIILTF